jgi:hypothetical protein
MRSLAYAEALKALQGGKQADILDKLNERFRHFAVCLYMQYFGDTVEHRKPGFDIIKWIVRGMDGRDVDYVLNIVKYTGKVTLKYSDDWENEPPCTGKTFLPSFVLQMQNTFECCESLANAIDMTFPNGDSYREQLQTTSQTVDRSATTEEEDVSALAAEGTLVEHSVSPLHSESQRSETALQESMHRVTRLLQTSADIEELSNNEHFKSLHEDYKRLAALLIRAVQDDNFVGRPCNVGIKWVCTAEMPCELYIQKPTEGSGFEILFSAAQSSSCFAAADVIRFSDIDLIVPNTKRVQEMTRVVGTLPEALDSFYGKAPGGELGAASRPKRRRTVESIKDTSVDPSASGQPPTAQMEMPPPPPQPLPQPPFSTDATTYEWQTVEYASQLVGQKLKELDAAERAAFVRIRAELESNVSIDDVESMKNVYTRAIILARSEVPGRQDLDSVNKAIDAIEHNLKVVTKWYERNKPS